MVDEGQSAVDGEEVEVAGGDEALSLRLHACFLLSRQSRHCGQVADEFPSGAHSLPHVVVGIGEQWCLCGIERTRIVSVVDGVVVPVHHPTVGELVELSCPWTGAVAAVVVVWQSVILQRVDGVEILLRVCGTVEDGVLSHGVSRCLVEERVAEGHLVGTRREGEGADEYCGQCYDYS